MDTKTKTLIPIKRGNICWTTCTIKSLHSPMICSTKSCHVKRNIIASVHIKLFWGSRSKLDQRIQASRRLIGVALVDSQDHAFVVS